MKQKLTIDDYEKVEKQSISAKMFLNNPKLAYVREYLNTAQEEIEQKILNNTIKEVHEEHTINERLKRVFVTPKKEQVEGLAEVYKFLNQFMSDMEETANAKDKLDEAEAQGLVIIEKSKE